MICKTWDVVVVPFPFTEKESTKRRPALVLSKRGFNEGGHTILAMITTKTQPPWPGDTEITQYADAGLHVPCIVRFKIFTLDNRLVLKKIGHLSQDDTKKVTRRMQLHLA